MAVRSITVTIEGYHVSDVRRIEKAVEISRRNHAVRQTYRLLRESGKKQPDAIAECGRQFGLSDSQINMILWPR